MLLVAILLSATAIIISYTVYSSTMDNHYRTNAMNIARAAASQMDGDKIGDYVKRVKAIDPAAADYKEKIKAIKDTDYNRMLQILYELKDSHNALYLYVQAVSADGAVYIIDADSGDTVCDLGVTFPLEEVNFQYLDSLENGLPAFITNSKYGWLCSAGAPIFNSQMQVVSLAFVDISMNQVMADRHRFLMLVCIALTITAAIATTFIILMINRTIVSPINSLSSAASKFISDKSNGSMEIDTESAISKLEIHTGDEIEKLTYAIKTMEKDINTYIKNLTLVTAEKERIGTELNVAKQIQAFVLPCIFPAFPGRKEFDIYATMQPAKEVGGDFYDFFLVDHDHLAIVIADVSGKGVPSALFMVISKSLIKNQAQAGYAPAEVFSTVNNQLCENNYAGMLITAWIGILEVSSGKLTYANAGHNLPLIKKNNTCYEYLKTPAGFTLAGMKNMKFRQFEIQMEPGDMLYLYTDGVMKATNSNNDSYGEERLLFTLNKNINAAPGELLIEVREAIGNFIKEAPQLEDITMLALQIGEKRTV